MNSLKSVMGWNAGSCIVFGILFILIPTEIAFFLGKDGAVPGIVLRTVGIILSLNGVHLLWARARSRPGKALVFYFCAGDFVWVLMTAMLLLSGVWITTLPGIIAAIVVAVMVACFGVLQVRLVNRRSMV